MKTTLIFLALVTALFGQTPVTNDNQSKLDWGKVELLPGGISPALIELYPTNLILAAGKGSIAINLKTGQVELPKDMTLPDAAVAFWLRVAQVFPECRQAMLTGNPTPLTTNWLGHVAIPLIVPRPPQPFDSFSMLIDGSGKRIEPAKTMVVFQEGYELGLRSDGVVVWRAVK